MARLVSLALAGALLLAAFVPPAFAQFPAPLPAPNLDLTGPPFTRAIARLPDGKIVVAAPFFRANGQARSFLVRLLPDGSVDTSWNPAPNSSVNALYVDALGRLYVSGNFSTIAGQPRTRLARFDASGALDAAWTPTSNGQANAFAPGTAGEICMAGSFTTVNGATRNRLACLAELDGALGAWNPDANGAVTAMLNANGSMYVGGLFTQVGTTARNRAARISLTGTGTVDAWNPAPNNNLSAIIVANASQLYVSGSFQTISGTARPGVARVDATTAAIDATWAPTGANVSIMPCLAPDGAGGVYVAGSFTNMGGQPRLNAARLSGTNGSAIAAWNPGIDFGYATACVAEPNGDIVIAGQFAAAGNGEHLGIARVFANGGVDPQFNTALETNASAFAIARVPGDGSLIVGGEFARAGGLIRRNLVRITPAGAIDPNWNPSTDGQVRAVSVDALGRVYVGGSYQRVNNTARNGLARLLATADGAPDTAWNPPANGSLNRILLRPEGLYVVGGAGAVGNLARVSIGATATVDTTWNPALDGLPTDIVATLDGSLVAVGAFANAGGVPRAGIAKIGTGATAVVDPVWAPQVTLATANTLRIAEFDNFIYLTGDITAVNGVARSRLAKISAVGSGALDTAWAPALTAAQGYGLRLAVDAAHVYVAGNVGGGFFRPFLQRYGKDDGLWDTTWRPQPDGGLFDVLVEPERVCVAGFTLQSLGGQVRRGFGCLPKTGVENLFADSFED